RRVAAGRPGPRPRPHPRPAPARRAVRRARRAHPDQGAGPGRPPVEQAPARRPAGHPRRGRGAAARRPGAGARRRAHRRGVRRRRAPSPLARPSPLRGSAPPPARRPRRRARHPTPGDTMTASLELTAGVLVIGGGPAAAWAALKAAQAGADVVLADKGYCGTSGAAASAGTGIWYVPPDPEAREKAMASREALGGYLADRRWMARVLDQTYDGVNELATAGRYPFPVVDGRPLRRGVQGPEYMRRMRIMVRRAGVRILDHSPVTELLTDTGGAVAGAAGHRLQTDETYRVRAAAVVLATGGCAFLSGTLGCHVNTGDGHLMAAELGA